MTFCNFLMWIADSKISRDLTIVKRKKKYHSVGFTQPNLKVVAMIDSCCYGTKVVAKAQQNVEILIHVLLLQHEVQRNVGQ